MLSPGDDPRAISFRLGGIARHFSIVGLGVATELSSLPRQIHYVLDIRKHMRMIPRQPGPFSDQYVLLQMTQQHEDDEHLDNAPLPPPPPRPIPTPLPPSTTTRMHSITLDGIYRTE
ncbi:hypothetical protein Goshw_001940 [Gossypium schwendimanii]|uniref:Uncharacterized protein n=1 Tax=Gossypium schwendimanii TaxID=34291 RepID=A0A7J9NED2_GOSSC|nr:hypothetical protein [Gossypium schwendimanii]